MVKEQDIECYDLQVTKISNSLFLLTMLDNLRGLVVAYACFDTGLAATRLKIIIH